MSDIQITFQDLSAGAKNLKLITFIGQLDETNVDHEAKRVYQVISEMVEPILLLDFSGLEYMNSKSIGYVTDWFTQSSAKNGSISIIGPRPNILDILKVVGITQIIPVYNTLEEAKATHAGPIPMSSEVAPAAPAAPAIPTPTPAATPEQVSQPTPVSAAASPTSSSSDASL